MIGAGVVTVVAVVVLWRASRRADALFLAAAVVGITVLVAGPEGRLRARAARPRPRVALPHSYSFPSGHAATAVVLYGALAMLLAERASSRPRAVGGSPEPRVLALAIGASRVLLNVHFVSDVAAGFAVGLAWLCCCADRPRA